MSEDVNEMSDAELAELAESQYAHREQLDAEAEDAEVVEDVEVVGDVSITMSFRLPGSEADQIRAAAAEHGQTLTEFIRSACRAAVGMTPVPSESDVDADAEAVVDALASAGLVVRHR